jgi:hypothetical protein
MIPADAWPAGDLLTWGDDETRLYHDFTDVPPTTRPYTVEENTDADERAARAAERANGNTLRTRANNALATNRTFLALLAPTTAEVVAQVRALSRQMNNLARLASNDLGGTD